MPNSSKSRFGVFGSFIRSRKAQFLIITALVIVNIFYLVSRWTRPYTIPDTSEIVLMEEPFIMNNLREEALEIVNTSSSCENLVDNLDEYKIYVEDYAFKKLILYFDYTLETPCMEYDPDFPILVIFDISIESSESKIKSQFYGFWPVESSPDD